MFRVVRLFVLALFLVAGLLRSVAKRGSPPIVERMFAFIESEPYQISHLDADVYVKFLIENERKNIAMRLIPFVGKQESSNRTYLGESYLRLSYTAPGIIDQKEVAFFSTMPYLRTLKDLIPSATSISFYQTTLLRDRILSPINRKNKSYYSYQLQAFPYRNDNHVVVRFRPNVYNMQLAEGKLLIDVHTGEVRRIDCSFEYNAQHIRFVAEMGDEGLERMLPKHVRFYHSFSFLKNKSRSEVDIYYRYNTLLPARKTTGKKFFRKGDYNLSRYNQLNIDTTKVVHTPLFFNENRFVPLQPNEDSIYIKHFQAQTPTDSSVHVVSNKSVGFSLSNWDDLILGSHRVKLSSNKQIKFPPIITPSMVEWSNRKGLSFKTQVKLYCSFNNNHTLAADAKLGYNCKTHDFYWKLPVNWLFSPRRQGRIHFEVGNGNKIYNSVQAEAVRKKLSSKQDYDSLLQAFNKHDFNYYHNFHLHLSASQEISNGLFARIGFMFHDRKLSDWNEEAQKNNIQRRFRSFAPQLRVDWTPARYFYWKNDQRVPLFSYWPTFSAEYERGLKIFGSNSTYERIELEATQKVSMRALRNLYLRMGGGFYTHNKQNTFFVDYSNFKYNSLPSNWQDKMDGAFESLDAHWYNESEYYVRASAAYEAPMLVLSHFRPLTRYIKRERLYCNLLQVHALKPYIESGYSVCTHLFDVGIFCGVANKKGISLGWNFSLRFLEND